MPATILVSEALHAFLQSHKTPANADLVDKWSAAMETQVNVAAGDGEPVAGKRSTYSNGIDTWHSIRIPKDANSEPTWKDYKLSFSIGQHAEGIGWTGWDWQNRRSRHVAFDFDSLMGHAKGVGLTEDELLRVKEAAMQLPYVEVRKSTGGGGLHLYVYFDAAGIPCENHTVHAALPLHPRNDVQRVQLRLCLPDRLLWRRDVDLAQENVRREWGLGPHQAGDQGVESSRLAGQLARSHRGCDAPRAKVRVNEVSDEKLDAFEALATSRKIIPLDDSHKAQIEALQSSGYTTLWVSDHHLLQTHTCALKELRESQQGKELGLIGVFETSSEGRNPAQPNCFLFPLNNGGWRVFRFSPGISEANTWSQDGQGWTTCYFNRTPNLATASRLHGGIEDPDKLGFTFRTPDDAVQVAMILGQKDISVDPLFADRRTLLKTHKDGRLVMEIERKKGDCELKEEPPGWLAKKTKWVRVYDAIISEEKEDDLGVSEFDGVIRAVKSTAKQFIGWKVRDQSKEWVDQPSANVKMMLQNRGLAKDAAECVMGASIDNGWRLVSLPFQPEYPGDRQWNKDAAQFVCPPAALEPDQTPHHPHWDMICDHIGAELTPVLAKLPWAIEANIRTGGDYIRAWIACAFREPFEQLPYLFLWGGETSGKSTLHEALGLLVTKGVVKADKALTSNEFNGELAGAIICAVEEKQINKVAGAYARMREWVTALEIAIRRMRTDVYTIPKFHALDSNEQLEVGMSSLSRRHARHRHLRRWFRRGRRNRQKKLLGILKEEAAHFIYTLLHLPLPPATERLRLRVVETAGKESLALDNSSVLQFVQESCDQGPLLREGLSRLFEAYKKWTWLVGFESVKLQNSRTSCLL